MARHCGIFVLLVLIAAKFRVGGIALIKGVVDIGYERANDESYVSHHHFKGNVAFQVWLDGRCVLMISIVGRGVKEYMEEPCRKTFPGNIQNENLLIVGDPSKDDLAFFTDAYATLVIIRKGKCVLKTYQTLNEETTSTQSDMDDAVCEDVKTRVVDEFEKNRLYWEKFQRRMDRSMRIAFTPGFPFQTPTPPEPDSVSEEQPPPTPYKSPYSDTPYHFHPSNTGETYSTSNNPSPASNHPIYKISQLSPQQAKISTFSQSTAVSQGNKVINIRGYSLSKVVSQTGADEECKMKVTVSGRGVEDSFEEECSKDTIPSKVDKDVLVFGNPHKDSFCLFSDEPATLIIVRNQICIKRFYRDAQDGGRNGKNYPVTIAKCFGYKRKMTNILESQDTQNIFPVMRPQPLEHNNFMRQLEERNRRQNEDFNRMIREDRDRVRLYEQNFGMGWGEEERNRQLWENQNRPHYTYVY